MQRSVLCKLLATGCVLLLASASGCERAPDVIAPPPAPSVDREFEQGSTIEARELSPAQVQHLALLAKVWGFTKYHHPTVTATASTTNWDFALFRVLPTVLAAPDRETATAAMVRWLDGLGAVPACSRCAGAASGAQLPANNAWISDAATLGAALSGQLETMLRNRSTAPSQRYVSFVPGIGNPDFSAEARYAALASPDAGYRLLALFRFWNIIAYWFPYRDVMNENWDGVLREFIPVMMRPMTGDTYRLALIRLIGRIHDTHANIWSDLRVQPPTGAAEAPLNLRFVEDKLIVTSYAHATLGPETGLRIGDEIRSIDGIPVTTLVDSLRPYFPASNEASRLRDIAGALTRGSGPVVLAGFGATGAFSRSVTRVPTATLDRSRRFSNDLPGPGGRRQHRQLHLAGPTGTRTGHRHPQLSQRVRGLCAWRASGRECDAVCTVHRGGCDQPRRVSLERDRFACTARAALHRLGGDSHRRGDAESGRVHDDGVSCCTGGRRGGEHDRRRGRQRVAHPVAGECGRDDQRDRRVLSGRSSHATHRHRA